MRNSLYGLRAGISQASLQNAPFQNAPLQTFKMHYFIKFETVCFVRITPKRKLQYASPLPQPFSSLSLSFPRKLYPSSA